MIPIDRLRKNLNPRSMVFSPQVPLITPEIFTVFKTTASTSTLDWSPIKEDVFSGMFFLLFFLLVNNIQVILSGHLLRIPLSEKRVTRIRGIAPTLYSMYQGEVWWYTESRFSHFFLLPDKSVYYFR